MAPAPMNVALLKLPFAKFAPLRSSGLFASPIVWPAHSICQYSASAGRALSIATVHGGAGEYGGLGGGGGGKGGEGGGGGGEGGGG
eukprot:scaffold99082_cov60-Phaeocystis_antarctica.AAC.1